MDEKTLAKYIGKAHVEEVQALMENDSQLLNKVSFKNPGRPVRFYLYGRR